MTYLTPSFQDIQSQINRGEVEFNYVLPTATDTTLGGVKINGYNLTIDGDGVLHASGGGSVNISGTPSDKQVAVWSNSNTIKGDAGFTYDSATETLTVTGPIVTTGGDSGISLISQGLVVNNSSGNTSLDDFRVKTALYNAIDVDSSNNSIQILSSGSGKLGFFGATPSIRSTSWTATNGTGIKSIDSDSLSLNTLADFVASIVTELKAKGLIA